MARVTFRAELRASPRGSGGHLVDVPASAIAKLGGKGRIPVTATFDGVPYRGSIVTMGGVAMIGVTKAIIAQARVEVGDVLTVVLENDDRPREVEIPDDLATAFRAHPGTRQAFDRLSYTQRREHVTSITEAKRPETRARRVERTIEALRERERAGPTER
jgi:hypothetical protein